MTLGLVSSAGRPRAARVGHGTPALWLAGASLWLSLAVPAARAEHTVDPVAARESDAERPAGHRGTWASLGVLGGTTRPDGSLGAYQWDTKPGAAFGAQALLGRGRFAGGLRLWRSQTTQRIDVPGVPTSPAVRSTSFEVVGHGRLAMLRGAEVLATTSAGRLHLGYNPDQVAIPSGGSGSPTIVDLRPIDEWIMGGGLAVRRALTPRWSGALAIERRFFELDTAHRNGSVIEMRRGWFGEWSARLEVARVFQQR